jgi:hypothetical protein
MAKSASLLKEGQMKRLLLAGFLSLLLVVAVVTVAVARNGNDKSGKQLSGVLEGFQEVPSISTNAEGSIKVKLNGSSIQFKLKYSGFTSQNKALVAHIHFAQEGVNGGVAAFLCGGNGRPACPETAGTVTGTITAANVKAIDAQGLAAGDIHALIRAIKAGYTYANVHSTKYGSGEIRGQIGDDDDDGRRGNHEGDDNGDEDDD